MARAKSVYVCTECGTQQPRWLGRCPGCGAWQSLVEEPVGAPATSGPLDLLETAAAREAGRAVPLRDVPAEAAPRVATGVAELDRVLGGGIVPGSVILIGGEPGIGKSTLCLQLALSIAGPHTDAEPRRVLYVTGEESLEQVRLRAARLGELGERVLALAETRVEALAK